MSLCLAVLAMAQGADSLTIAQEADSVRIKGVHPWDLEQNKNGIKPEIAHWSIIPRIGFSAFDGDYPHLMKHPVAIPSAGLALEYNFTPVWNVGIEYVYDMYTVTGKGGRLSVDTLLNGHMHRAGAYLSLDLINLFFPRAKKKIVSLLPYVGAGGAWYKRSHYYKDDYYINPATGEEVNPTHKRDNTNEYINDDNKVGPDHDKKYRMIGYFQAGLDLDFNLNRTLALGLRANYSYFTRDYVDGRGYHKHTAYAAASKNNDGIFDVMLYMRFKLEAVSKSHPRNMPSFKAFDDMVEKTQPQILLHDTLMIYHRHDSIIIRESVERLKKNARVFNVYFDNDKADLRNDALTTIFEATQYMEGDTSLYAVLIGYCDNTASKAHNYVLGDRRAKNVMEEMHEEYGIPESHMYNAGIGKIAARKTARSFGPNRRVSIHLVDKETFELMKLELQDKNDTKNTDENEPVTYENSRAVRIPVLEDIENEAPADSVETVSLYESSRKEAVNPYSTNRKNTLIVVEKGMTLSKLARQYYDNSQCWVYIYMANEDTLNSPADLREGMELVIPELTKEELQIDTKECLRLYSITAHKKAKK